MWFAVVPLFPVLVDGWLGPEVPPCDDVILDGLHAAVFAAEDEFEVVFSGAFDLLGESFSWESQRPWLSAFDVDVLWLID